MKDTMLFDLGNTLAYYFEKHEFPTILKQAITEVQNFLLQKGILKVSPEVMWRKVRDEDHESTDDRVRPLEERLVRIFQIGDLAQSCDIVMAMCRCFMKSIFARAICYQDTISTLKS